jgi:hypothetical protein
MGYWWQSGGLTLRQQRRFASSSASVLPPSTRVAHSTALRTWARQPQRTNACFAGHQATLLPLIGGAGNIFTDGVGWLEVAV